MDDSNLLIAAFFEMPPIDGRNSLSCVPHQPDTASRDERRSLLPNEPWRPVFDSLAAAPILEDGPMLTLITLGSLDTTLGAGGYMFPAAGRSLDPGQGSRGAPIIMSHGEGASRLPQGNAGEACSL